MFAISQFNLTLFTSNSFLLLVVRHLLLLVRHLLLVVTMFAISQFSLILISF